MPNYRKFIESYITLNFFQLNYQNKKKEKKTSWTYYSIHVPKPLIYSLASAHLWQLARGCETHVMGSRHCSLTLGGRRQLLASPHLALLEPSFARCHSWRSAFSAHRGTCNPGWMGSLDYEQCVFKEPHDNRRKDDLHGWIGEEVGQGVEVL